MSSEFPVAEWSSKGNKADFKVGDETFQTWYTIIGGDLKKQTRRPLVGLHGGPGASHYILLGLKDLVASHNVPIVLYDQLGSGNSTHLKDKPKEFWTPELFMDELENLLSHLEIDGDFDLLGHSWGGMLSSSFAAFRQPKGLKHLILSDSPASMDLFEQETGKLIRAMPQDIQDAIKKHEDAGTTDSQEYQDAMNAFYAKHLIKVVPNPPEVVKTFEVLEADPTVYHTMNGPSEWHCIGTLRGWSIIPLIHKIKAKTLLINGVDDEVQDACVAPFFQILTDVKWVVFANSSHCPMWEERERYMKIVGDFVTS